MVLFASFAAVALLLASVGVYGLMAYAVSQRTQEIGLRLALGSGRHRVIWLILKEASLLAAIGLGVGLAGAMLVGRTMRYYLVRNRSHGFIGHPIRGRDPFSHRPVCFVPAGAPGGVDRSDAGTPNRLVSIPRCDSPSDKSDAG
jgi:FtsX-like permease family